MCRKLVSFTVMSIHRTQVLKSVFFANEQNSVLISTGVVQRTGAFYFCRCKLHWAQYTLNRVNANSLLRGPCVDSRTHQNGKEKCAHNIILDKNMQALLHRNILV